MFANELDKLVWHAVCVCVIVVLGSKSSLFVVSTFSDDFDNDSSLSEYYDALGFDTTFRSWGWALAMPLIGLQYSFVDILSLIGKWFVKTIYEYFYSFGLWANTCKAIFYISFIKTTGLTSKW